METVSHVRRGATYEMMTDLNPVVAVHISDKEDMECEYIRPPSEASGLNASAAGPGLDSDFGASAGTPQTHNSTVIGTVVVYNCCHRCVRLFKMKKKDLSGLSWNFLEENALSAFLLKMCRFYLL